jgi:hypothetical protein
MLFFCSKLTGAKYEGDYENDLKHGQGIINPGNTRGGSITVPLTSCLTGLESAVQQLTIFVFICKTD